MSRGPMVVITFSWVRRGLVPVAYMRTCVILYKRGGQACRRIEPKDFLRTNIVIAARALLSVVAALRTS